MKDVIKELLNKLTSVTGIFYPISSTVKTITDNKNQLRNFQSAYDMKFKYDILERKELDDCTRAALISDINKSTIKFYNQVKILDVAINNIRNSADPKCLDDDWLFYFMNKAAYISDEQMRNTWGAILAEACDNPEICTKTLINTLSLMNKKQAETFKCICKFRFANMNIPADETEIISIYPIIFFSKNAQGYANHGLTNRGILELEHLGLINIDSNKEFVVYTDLLKLRDRKNSIEVIGNGKIEIGNITFTYDGFLLQRIIENYYDSQIMDYNIQIWCHKGYKVYRNGKRQDV
ncbi:MAG: DUF2806 domain-containing protein [Lachnospiraceae bacterium]|nr:DUF2806 domain-containing protein [Lachnospiraceae bacterium]